jgi:ferrochelatase
MPNFINSSNPPHDINPTTGILLTNLGTPEAPTSGALRRYLAEFLNDPRVIETPRLIWWPILYGIILTFRPRRSAHAYGKVWTDKGSPLLVNLQTQAKALETVLADSVPFSFKVEIAMRYGEPSIKNALRKLRESNIQRLLVFPLYPQYSATTTASTFDAITNELQKWRWVPEVRFISHYHDDPGYITALASSIRSQWDEKGRPEKLLFSFHGLPKKYFQSGDPYFCECHKTARLVAKELSLEDSLWQVAFQSRFGPMEWLQPYTDVVLEAWANEGVSNVHVICPGFSADCLETLEEIQIQYRSLYLKAGGKHFTNIPALNDKPDHINALGTIITRHCAGWEQLEWDSKLINTRAEQIQHKA